MTAHSDPSRHVPPSETPETSRSAAGPNDSGPGLFRTLTRAPLLAMRRWRSSRTATAPQSTTGGSPTGGSRAPSSAGSSPAALFRPGEVEYAHLQSLPPFVSDHLVLTDRRILRVHTDDSGAIAQLSQAASRQIRSARSECFRDRATVTVELHIGSSLRLEEAAPDEADRFIATVDEAAARWRA